MWYNTKGKGSSDNMDKIIIKGARENNLKNINIEIPKNKLVVMTGVSGSGKSSLAFDTIYAEGQRRYVESLSAYARQFLGSSGKPDVDVIEGLSPSISIDQKTTNKNPRSTVGTVTEIYDYLRLLFARVGVPHCPNHHIPISSQSIEEMTNKILELEENTKIMVMSPVVKGEKGTQKDLFEKLRKEGYIRIKVEIKENNKKDPSQWVTLYWKPFINKLEFLRLILSIKSLSPFPKFLEALHSLRNVKLLFNSINPTSGYNFFASSKTNQSFDTMYSLSQYSAYFISFLSCLKSSTVTFDSKMIISSESG